ncbi:NUDIX hydrolase [Sphingosinicella ginsenosidimutans]|uniref:NUDIX domain-containing protein n=1 Tax=Allosphingosinicella ginsenosidimutans TaxID=1176539 RepID=A0A5C6TS13_9SPHN|nr:NUDIX domain-containing protein [Sphingosinicella ginsenosidimutans]TXC63026.1 NUDIX domain-containing protein [Sphingosinicella ginsenosidimutans]
MADDLPEPIPAATLVLMRSAGSGPPELLTIERGAGMAFAAGALAFPGGRIDDEDRAAAAAYPALSDAAARIAAIRETIEETGLGGSLAPGDLTPFARWCPNFRETRRFDTLFYLAEAGSDWPAPVAAAHEVGRVFWASAAATLAEIAAGRAHAIFPTRRNLERLARFGSIEEARADAACHPVRKITPWIEDRDGEPFLRIPDDAGYPVTSEPLATARRR